MKNISQIVFLIFALVIVSCNENNDDELIVPETSTDIIITTETNTGTINSNGTQSIFTFDTPLDNNKRRGTTFTDDDGSSLFREFIYNSEDILTGLNSVGDEGQDFEFSYDDNNELTEIVFVLNPTTTKYYRIVKQSDNKYFHEWVSLPPSNPATQIIRRIIVEFDENDNIVKAGIDSNDNLDGDYDTFRLFTYSDNQNLLQVIDENGDEFNFEYSTIKNTQVFIDRMTLGKKNHNLQSAELFGMVFVNSDFAKYSSYVSLNEINENSYVFEIHDATDFFTKRTTTQSTAGGNGTVTSVLTYLFE